MNKNGVDYYIDMYCQTLQMIEDGESYIEALSAGAPTEVQRRLIAATRQHIDVLRAESLKLEEAEEIDEIEAAAETSLRDRLA